MKKILLWILAFLITAGSAVYQRMTGPTYPLDGKIELGNEEISYTLERSQETIGDYEIRVDVKNPGITGNVIYQRFTAVDILVSV